MSVTVSFVEKDTFTFESEVWFDVKEGSKHTLKIFHWKYLPNGHSQFFNRSKASEVSEYSAEYKKFLKKKQINKCVMEVSVNDQ